MIQLEPHDEHLRDTVFYKIFGNTLLFDSMETAQAHRLSQIARNQNSPTMYTRDGNCLPSDGSMDPTVGRNRMPHHFNYVFGEQPPRHKEQLMQQIQKGKNSFTAK